MAKAKPGFCLGESVDGVILVFLPIAGNAVSIGEIFLVENGVGNDVFFAGPCAQIKQAAPFTAEREVGMNRRVGFLLADGAAVLHVAKLIPKRATALR